MNTTTIVLTLLTGALITPPARSEGVADIPSPPAAVLAVDYADTAQGIIAKLTVSSCARAEAPAAGFEIRETIVPSQVDIVVRMIDADGREISRTVGSAAVCQYARFAAAYFLRMRHSSNRNEQ